MCLWCNFENCTKSTHTPRLIDNTEQSKWYYTVPYVEVLYIIDCTFHMNSKGSNLLCLHNFLWCHLTFASKERRRRVYSWLMTPRWDANQTLQSSVIFVWAKKLTVKTKTLGHLAADFSTVNYDPGRRVFLLKSVGMCSSTFSLEGHIEMVLNFRNIKLIQEITSRLTVA